MLKKTFYWEEKTAFETTQNTLLPKSKDVILCLCFINIIELLAEVLGVSLLLLFLPLSTPWARFLPLDYFVLRENWQRELNFRSEVM